MKLTGHGKAEGVLSPDEIRAIFKEGIEGLPIDGRKVLVLTPDATRTIPLAQLFRLVVEFVRPRVARLDFMVALGTHPALSRQRLNAFFGLTEELRRGEFAGIEIFNHEWDNPAALARIGTLTSEVVEEISEGRMSEEVPVDINRRIFDYDEVLVLGPTFPHEVVGFSGGDKYFFPGICGPEFLNFFHWLGALITNVRIIGFKDTPVRRMIDKAMEFVPVLRHCMSLVTTREGVKGAFIGESAEAWSAAADLSSEIHIVYKPRKYKLVLSIAPDMYDDMWTAAKCMYKLEPVIEEGGTLIILAPHVTEISYTHGKVIDEIGYHCRDYFLENIDRFGEVPRGVMAHSTHLRGGGICKGGIEKCHVDVILATGIKEDRCRMVNLGFMDPASINVSEYEGREDEGILVVHHAGEILHRLESERVGRRG